MKELAVKATTENLNIVLDFVTAELESAGCPINIRNKVSVAVEEVFVNIAHYAYTCEIGCTLIRIDADSEVVIVFEDKGMPYNPLEKSDPDITASLDEREIGGMGIFMVKNIMDAVEYRYENGKNILVIKKSIA